MNERLKLTYAFEQSKLLLKGRSLRTAATLLLYNLLLTISFFLFYYAVLFIAALLVYAFADKSMVITVFLSAYPTINFYLFIFFGMVAFTSNMNVISSMFATYREEYFTEILLDDARFHEGPHPVKVKSHNRIITGILIFMLSAAIFNFYLTIRNDNFYLRDALSGIMITSHRGNSHVAPENTLPALENAIIARSDYAEIDIQQTKDGEIVLLHDQSLWRTSGLNRYIWELTYAEVKELDVGSWYGEEFKNTKIPTLAEVFKLCKGRIKLNIEVKTNAHSKNMEEQLVALIEQYDFERQCVVSSWNYDTLVDIKERNSDIKTGYIMSVTYGNFYDREFIDFFSIRSGFISKYVVDSAHRAGKEVHAWTVNSVNEIERMKSVGVDCIITDNPSLALEIVYQNDTNKTLIELLNKMLYRRSFYKIVQSDED
jgi:glycerophosphoryl diester phosphodiesterase